MQPCIGARFRLDPHSNQMLGLLALHIFFQLALLGSLVGSLDAFHLSAHVGALELHPVNLLQSDPANLGRKACP